MTTPRNPDLDRALRLLEELAANVNTTMRLVATTAERLANDQQELVKTARHPVSPSG